MQFNRCLGCMEETKGYPCPHCGFDPRKVPASNYVLPYGTVLNGHYVVGRVLGQGGFGITYIGFDLSLQRKVAIKEFYPKGQAMRMSTMSAQLQWGDDAASQDVRTTGMDSFLREARKMAKVEDIPEIVRVRESFLENDTAYIIMDYIEGRTLLSVLKEKGPMPWEKAKDIFLPAISAMEKVHQAGLVHRDLSPDNLMLTGKGVRILDLGAAKDLSVGNGASSAQVAKSGFSPFEQYTQRGGSGPWSDVYAMAATIYYTLTGVLPPNANDRVEEDSLDWKLLTSRNVPANVISALQKAMTVSAKSRTQSMGAFLSQLQSAGTPHNHKKKTPYIVIAAAAVVVLLGFALGFGVSGKNQPENPAMALPPETQAVETTAPQETTMPTQPPIKVNVMAAAEDLQPLYVQERENQTFWGQVVYKRSDVKTVTFRGSLKDVPRTAWDVSEAGDRSILAWMEDGNLFVAADGIIAPNPNASWMFAFFVNVTAIDFGDCFDTSNVINMSEMFSACDNLTQLDVSGFDTAKVTNMAYMFWRCKCLTELDVSGFDTSKVTNMRWMFCLCESLTQLDISGFNTANVTYMDKMFSFCENLTKLDISGFDTANVTDMSGMFSGCHNLVELDVSGFDTSSVTRMFNMFAFCKNLTKLDISSFDTAKVTEMGDMFAGCSSLTELDASGFDTAKVTDMSSMFSHCTSLTTLNVSGFDTANVTDMRWMFKGCTKLNDFKCTDQRIRAEYNRRWN